MSTSPQTITPRLSALPDPEDKLTPLQAAFVEAYTGKCWLNGTRAYQLAGYTGNDSTAAVEAHRLLRIPKVRQAIDSRLATSHLTKDEIVAELSGVGRAQDWRKKPHISSAKLKALELVGKAHGLFIDRSESTSKVDLQVTVNLERVESVIQSFCEALGLARDVAIAELARAGTLTQAHVKALAAAEQTIDVQAEPYTLTTPTDSQP